MKLVVVERMKRERKRKKNGKMKKTRGLVPLSLSLPRPAQSSPSPHAEKECFYRFFVLCLQVMYKFSFGKIGCLWLADFVRSFVFFPKLFGEFLFTRRHRCPRRSKHQQRQRPQQYLQTHKDWKGRTSAGIVRSSSRSPSPLLFSSRSRLQRRPPAAALRKVSSPRRRRRPRRWSQSRWSGAGALGAGGGGGAGGRGALG